MEVIGVVSSVLSLVDIAIRSSNAVKELISNWKDVPVEIVALGNEISDSETVLIQASQIIRCFQAGSDAVQNYTASHVSAIERQLEQAGPIWVELETTLRDFAADDDTATIKLSKFRKYRWMRNRKKLEDMRKILRDKRHNITELLVSSSA